MDTIEIAPLLAIGPEGNSTREQLTITTNAMLPGPPIEL